MAGPFTVIDLSQLPPPTVVEPLDFETILSEMLTDLRARDPVFDALVESDPAYKVLEVAAYRELLIRQRVNDAARAVMLAFAAGADLDQIGANRNVARLVLDPGDPDAIPPVAPTYEADVDYRYRIQIAPEGDTTAGSTGSYVFHGLSADGQVKDIQPTSPNPGDVVVFVLSRAADGTASAPLLAKVEAALNAERVRPLTDNVTVETATIVEYQIEAELTLYPGPDADVVKDAAEAAAAVYAASVHRIKFDAAISGIERALHQPGVKSVDLTDPPANVVCGDGEAPFCTGIVITINGSPDV